MTLLWPKHGPHLVPQIGSYDYDILFMNQCFIVYIRTMKGVGPFWPIHTGASGVGSPCDCVNFSYGFSKPE